MSKSAAGLEIHVVEDHNEALDAIYRHIGAKRLDFDRLVLVHFDSHPDLGLPAELDAGLVYERETLLEALSIENWILPAVYAGHLATVVWVRPPWARQIDAGSYRFTVGRHRETGRLKCSCSASYFVSDGSYAPAESLEDGRELTLLVVDIDQLVSTRRDPDVYEAIQAAASGSGKRAARRIVLDVDLDFFSTQDPFRLMFADSDDYELFRRVYYHPLPAADHPEFDALYADFERDRAAKLDRIWSVLSGKQVGESVADAELTRLREAFLRNGVDAELVHAYGACIDDRPLPHHVSSEPELGRLMGQFEAFLHMYFGEEEATSAARPSLVTVARSSLDDYCPVDQVDAIQADTLAKLTSHFKLERPAIKLDYLSD